MEKFAPQFHLYSKFCMLSLWYLEQFSPSFLFWKAVKGKVNGCGLLLWSLLHSEASLISGEDCSCIGMEDFRHYAGLVNS